MSAGRGTRRDKTTGRIRLLVILAVLGVAAVLIVRELDVGKAIREVTLPLKHEDIIRQQAERFDLDPALVAAIINQESGFSDETSHAGARGLMQITPATADTIETLSGGETFVYEDLADPDLNIRYGTFYLRHLLDRFERQRDRGASGLQRRARERVGVGRGRPGGRRDPVPRDPRLRRGGSRRARQLPGDVRGGARPLSRPGAGAGRLYERAGTDRLTAD